MVRLRSPQVFHFPFSISFSFPLYQCAVETVDEERGGVLVEPLLFGLFAGGSGGVAAGFWSYVRGIGGIGVIEALGEEGIFVEEDQAEGGIEDVVRIVGVERSRWGCGIADPFGIVEAAGGL